ncbi:MAG: DNA replication and repair protein RecF [Saprospiraceae bacterium]|nr:DNA replication and repair protein RecF [Saprospiraceae bacterium]
MVLLRLKHHELYLKSISLHHFKSYRQANFDFSPHLNVIFGGNGVGKTNLLDAIFALAMTKSNFAITDQQLINDKEDFFRLQGVVSKRNEPYKLVLKLQRGKKKAIEKDGSTIAKALDHIGFMPVVMITPDDLNLINASNSERRKLADTTLSQVHHDYLESLVIYNRLLKQRNTLLKSWQERGTFDAILLETYDLKMDGPAKVVHQYRGDFFRQLLDRLQYYYEILCQGNESVDLLYQSEMTQSTFSNLCRKNLTRDRSSARTNSGVHRDSVDCMINGRDARTYASQGQKKSLVFAIKLAQLDYMRDRLQDSPLMLLDDVFDKLDQYRVDRLLSIILSDTFGQVFITDTQWQRIAKMLDAYAVDIQKIEIKGV